jgi:hypothetical protein
VDVGDGDAVGNGDLVGDALGVADAEADADADGDTVKMDDAVADALGDAVGEGVGNAPLSEAPQATNAPNRTGSARAVPARRLIMVGIVPAEGAIWALPDRCVGCRPFGPGCSDRMAAAVRGSKAASFRCNRAGGAHHLGHAPEAVEAARRLPGRRTLVMALVRSAEVSLAADRPTDALPALDEALGLLDLLGVSDWVSDTLALTARARGRLPADATPATARESVRAALHGVRA